MNHEDLRLYTVAEVAELLGFNQQVVQRKLAAGDLPGYRLGKEWRVERSQLLTWLERHSNQRDRTLDPYFEESGRLKKLPAARAKREAALARMAASFEPDRAYRETEVNTILRGFHEDVATIRRALVETGHFVRTTNGVYKRKGPTEAALAPRG